MQISPPAHHPPASVDSARVGAFPLTSATDRRFHFPLNRHKPSDTTLVELIIALIPLLSLTSVLIAKTSGGNPVNSDDVEDSSDDDNDNSDDRDESDETAPEPQLSQPCPTPMAPEIIPSAVPTLLLGAPSLEVTPTEVSSPALATTAAPADVSAAGTMTELATSPISESRASVSAEIVDTSPTTQNRRQALSASAVSSTALVAEAQPALSSPPSPVPSTLPSPTTGNKQPVGDVEHSPEPGFAPLHTGPQNTLRSVTPQNTAPVQTDSSSATSLPATPPTTPLFPPPLMIERIQSAVARTEHNLRIYSLLPPAIPGADGSGNLAYVSISAYLACTQGSKTAVMPVRNTGLMSAEITPNNFEKTNKWITSQPEQGRDRKPFQWQTENIHAEEIRSQTSDIEEKKAQNEMGVGKIDYHPGGINIAPSMAESAEVPQTANRRENVPASFAIHSPVNLQGQDIIGEKESLPVLNPINKNIVPIAFEVEFSKLHTWHPAWLMVLLIIITTLTLTYFVLDYKS